MMRILFDTNVLLDLILEREPHVRAAAEILAGVETGLLAGLFSSTTATTTYYLVERRHSRERALQGLRRLMMLLEVAPITRAVLEGALALDFEDFEDAVQHEAGRHAATDGIVTRNPADYSQASLAIYTPSEMLEVIRERS